MKRVIFALCCIGFLIIFGCGEDPSTPENFGKNYIEKKFNGLGCDLGDLDYKVTEDGEDKATIEIKGKIKYKEKLYLIKLDGKWLLASEACKLENPKTQKKAAPEKKAQPD